MYFLLIIATIYLIWLNQRGLFPPYFCDMAPNLELHCLFCFPVTLHINLTHSQLKSPDLFWDQCLSGSFHPEANS